MADPRVEKLSKKALAIACVLVCWPQGSKSHRKTSRSYRLCLLPCSLEKCEGIGTERGLVLRCAVLIPRGQEHRVVLSEKAAFSHEPSALRQLLKISRPTESRAVGLMVLSGG